MTKLSYLIYLIVFSFVLFACDKSYQPEALQLEQNQPLHVTTFNQNSYPEKLSDWGLFYIQSQQLKLHSTAVPFHLNTPLFSDYAHKFRSIWIPKDSLIQIEKDRLVFPLGAILSKTFYYPRVDFDGKTLTVQQVDKAHSSGSTIPLTNNHLIETRLLIKEEDGWTALPYLWNKKQTEASLEITGGSQTLKLVGNTSQNFTYIVPDANQCKGCHATNHSDGKIMPIGPKLHHLNLDYSYNDEVTQNQLKYLQEKGLLKSFEKINSSEKSYDWNNRNQDIANAARSYLDINCAHCHNPNGAADTSALYLNRENNNDSHLGFCKPPVAAGKGSGNRPFDIYPGNSDNSIISFRMQSNDPSIVMPELGRSVIHEEGVELIDKWINQLEGNCEIPQA